MCIPGARRPGKSKHNQPVSSCRLLYLYIACGKQCAQLGVFTETHQQNIYDKCNKQKNHCISEAFSEYFFYSCSNSILSEIWINYGCIDIEAFTQTYQYRPEVINQSAGTNG